MKTRILFICLDMDPMSKQGDKNTGAAHLYVKESLELLSKNNIETVAFTRWDSTSKPLKENIGHSVTLYRIKVGDIDYKPKEFLWGKGDYIYKKSCEILDDLDFSPTIIHAVYWYSGVVGEKFVERYKTPFIYTVISLGKVKHLALSKKLNIHDIDRENSEQRIMQKADGIISVSDQEKNNILQFYNGIDKTKIYNIGRGIDPSQFSNTNSRKNIDISEIPLYLFFAGRLISSKGLSFLFEVYDNILKDESIDTPALYIAGGTEGEIKNIKNILPKSKQLSGATKNKKIRWLGIIDRNDMPNYYRNALATCLPSIYDPAARVVLESMACGTPIIMTNTGYSNELVFNGVNGYIANYGDVEKWTIYIKALINDPAWREKLGKRAHDSIFPYYSLEEFGKRQLSVYEKVQGENSSRKFSSKKEEQEIRRILPEWDVPKIFSTYLPEDKIEPRIDSWIRENEINPEKIEEIPQNNISSSRVFRIQTSQYSNGLILKQPKDKMLYYRMFYPTNHSNEAYIRSANARWHAEITNSEDEFFLPTLASNEKYRFILRENFDYKEINWDKLSILSLFRNINALHRRKSLHYASLINDYQTRVASIKREDDWLNLYDEYLNKINANFRNGEIWFTPAQANIELVRINQLRNSIGLITNNSIFKKILSQSNQLLRIKY